MRIFKFFILLVISSFLLIISNNTFANNGTKPKGLDSDKNKKEAKKDTLREGVDNLLYQKRKRDVDINHTVLKDAALCDLDAKFNLKVQGLSVEFVNRAEGEFTDIEWTFGDGYLSQDILSAQHTYEKEGMYYFSMTVYNALNSCIDVYSGHYFLSSKNSKK